MVGRKMRIQRIEHGLTQKALGRKLGVSFQQVQKYEAGVNAMSAERLWQLTKIFSVPMQYWVTGEEIFAALEDKGSAEVPSAAADRRAIHLMHYFTRIGDEEIKSLLFAFSKALAGIAATPSAG